MAETREARVYYVVGMVQGVGYRFFVQRVARRIGVAGYVKNLPDGRVEVYAVGSRQQLHELSAELKRGPSAAEVSEVHQESAEILSRYESGFAIEHEGW